MSEAKHAAKDGARLQPNSGRGKFHKGDATLQTDTGLYVIDYKEYSKQYGISKDNWAKICSDALKVDFQSEPVLKLVLGGTTELAVLDWSWFLALANKEV